MKRSLPAAAVVACGALLALSLLAPSAAQPRPDDAALAARLRAIVEEAGLGDRVGISVVSTESGEKIYGHHEDLALNPASNMKLVTAAGALLELGPDFTMLTGLYGRVEDGVVSDLSLRGFGDPSLRMSDLVELAEGLRDRGVRRVERVIVDGGYFDDQYLPPAFDQQPGEVSSFRAPVAATSVERSAYELRVVPGEEGGPAQVRLDAEGYFDLDSRITTGGALNVIADQSGDGEKMELRVSGTVPADILGVGYRRRVNRPLPYAGHAMVEALRRTGIRTPGHVRIGDTPEGLPLLVARRSPPVSELISAMGKSSDNFTAEMILKVIGAERSRPGTSATGAQVLEEMLAEAGVPADRVTVVNGSGLFDGNEIAASHLTKLLVHVYNDPGVRPEYLAHLAVGGVDGTLHRRLGDLPRPRVVRAKTGTLNDVIALSGYVLGPEPDRAVAFSFLANGIRGRQGEARRAADDLARAIATHLWGG